MSIVTVVVAAEIEESSELGEALQPLNEWSGIELPGMDSDRVAALHCLLTGDTLHDALETYEPVHVSDNGVVVLQFADALCERLANAEEDVLAAIAEELVAAEEFENAHWDADDVLDLLNELAGLAQLAESQGQALFVWMRYE